MALLHLVHDDSGSAIIPIVLFKHCLSVINIRTLHGDSGYAAHLEVSQGNSKPEFPVPPFIASLSQLLFIMADLEGIPAWTGPRQT